MLPFSLEAHRLGIQWTLVMLLCSPLLYIKDIPSMTRASANYISIYALLVWDPTCGGALKKSMDRFLAIFISIALCLPIWFPVWLAGYRDLKENGWMWWAFFAAAVMTILAWNFIRYHYPAHRILYIGGATSSVYAYSMVYNDWLGSMIEGSIAKLLGVIGGTLVFQFVLRVPARDRLVNELAKSVNQLSLLLEPLIELDSGLLHSPSFLHEAHSPLKMVAQRAFSKQLSKGSMQRRSSLRRLISKSSSVGCSEPLDVDFDIFHAFKERTWEQVNAVHKTLQAQPLLLRGAVMEVMHKHPRLFPKRLYVDLSTSVQRLFFHVASIYSILETQEAVLQVDSRSFVKAAGEQWVWARIATTGKRLIKFGQVEHVALPIPLTRLRPQSAPLLKPPKRTLSHIRPDSLANITSEQLLSTMGALEASDDGTESSTPEMPQEPEFYNDIAAGTIMKWGNQFAPLIGRMTRHLSAAVQALGESLETRKITDTLNQEVQRSFEALAELEKGRSQCSRTVQAFVDQMVLIGKGSELERTIDEDLLQRYLGLTRIEYCDLNAPARALLWSAFGNMQDRLTHTVAMLTTIAAQLKNCANALETFYVAMRYKQDNATTTS